MSQLDIIHEAAMDEVIFCLQNLTNAYVDIPVKIREDEYSRELSVTVKFLDEVVDDLVESFIYLYLDKDDGAFVVANSKQYEISEMSVWLSLFFNKEKTVDEDIVEENIRLKKEIAILKGNEKPPIIIVDGWK